MIFASEGFQGPADRLAEEIGMEPGLVFPIVAAPDIDGLDDDTEVIVYLGRDVVDLPYLRLILADARPADPCPARPH